MYVFLTLEVPELVVLSIVHNTNAFPLFSLCSDAGLFIYHDIEGIVHFRACTQFPL
jgi:hypothetical protein